MAYRSKKEIEAAVEAQSEGDVEKIFGPSELDSGQVWEVWVFVKQDDEYYTRFVFDDGVNDLEYFSEFQQHCIFVNRSLDKLRAEIDQLKSDSVGTHAAIRQRNIVLYVASFVFIVCSLSLLALIFLERAQGTSAFVLLGGLIASGSGMFFGKWIRP